MKYVINMLAKPESITTSQMNKNKDVDSVMNIYLKNSFVCFSSIYQHNKDIRGLLFVNFNLDKDWCDMFAEINVKIVKLPFGNFSISNSFAWSVVQYRYDVIKYLTEKLKDNDLIIMLDTDIYCTKNLDYVYDEIKENLLMFDVQHSLENIDRKRIIDNYFKIYKNKSEGNLIHYGGEFIGANKNNLKVLYDACVEVFERSKNVKDLENFNDEHITSIAVYNKCRNIVSNANAYIFRYWTNKFYLVSTNYVNNPVCLWHLPAEKKLGMIKLFNYFLRKKKYPKDLHVAKIVGFPKARKRITSQNFFMSIKEYFKK